MTAPEDRLEYVFFHHSVCAKLSDHLAGLGIPSQVREADGVITLSHTDAVDEVLLEQIEDYYDTLFDEESRLANDSIAATDGSERDLVGIGAELADGRLIQVRLDAELSRRLLSVLSAQQLRELVQEVIRQAENPIDGPLCKGPVGSG